MSVWIKLVRITNKLAKQLSMTTEETDDMDDDLRVVYFAFLGVRWAAYLILGCNSGFKICA